MRLLTCAILISLSAACATSPRATNEPERRPVQGADSTQADTARSMDTTAKPPSQG